MTNPRDNRRRKRKAARNMARWRKPPEPREFITIYADYGDRTETLVELEVRANLPIRFNGGRVSFPKTTVVWQ